MRMITVTTLNTICFASARMTRTGIVLAAALTLAPIVAPSALASQSEAPRITISNGHFNPAKITIAAGKKVKLMVKNSTALPAEFESYDFTVEKVIPGHTTLPVYVGPLKAGTYKFFNDFAQNVNGTLIVK